jgi:HAMP domain-containing protein
MRAVLLGGVIKVQCFLFAAFDHNTHRERLLIGPTIKLRRTAKNIIGGMLRGDAPCNSFS